MSLQSRLNHACLEVAIEGSTGATLEQFWGFIKSYQEEASTEFNAFDPEQTTVISSKFELDKGVKEWIWSDLIKLKSIYLLENNKDKEKEKDKNKLPFDIQNYSEVEKNQQNFKIFADDDLIYKAGLGNSSVSYIAGKELEVLEVILKARENGITQKSLVEYFKVSPKNMYSLLKRLLFQKLVVKLAIVHSQAHTHLFIHHRYLFQNSAYLATLSVKQLHVKSNTELDNSPQTTENQDDNNQEDEVGEFDKEAHDFEISLQGDDLKVAITELLDCAKSKTMYIDELCEALGIQNCNRRTRTRLNRLIHNLGRQNYLRRFVVTAPNTGHLKRCVRVLKLYKPNGQNPERTLITQSKSQEIYIGQPLYSQFFNLIIEAGSKGVTFKDLSQSSGGLSIRYIERIVDRLLKTNDANGNPLCIKVNEFHGRMKYNRIYSFEKYQTITSLESSLELDKNVQTVMEKLRELDLLKSNTLKTRYEVIIQLLWSLKVCRVDVELIQAAKEEFNKRGISSSMDKKTLGAIMSTLESHNIVNKHKLSIKTLAGEPIEFNIFYLYLYSTESPEVQTWIDDQRNRMIMNIPKKPHSSEPQQSAEVDSWADIKKSLDPAKLAFFEGAGKLIGSVPNQTPAISEFQDPGSDKYWLVSSLRTGYVHASMIRAQILHLSMLRILNEFSINDTSTASFVKSNINPERIISTEMLFNKMTLMAYMNLVVIGRPTDELFEFISNPQNLKLILENLPPNIKKIVFSTYTKYKSRMKANMGVLLNLGLVYPVKKKDDDSGIPYQSSMNDVEEHLKEESLVPFYYMAPEVPMYDYGIENYQSKKMGICQVRTIEQVTKFWKDLERISTRHSKSIDNNITLPPEVQQLETKLEKSRLAKYYRVVQPISIIRNTHHWRICNSHSPDQRKLLESFVDRRRGLTPLNDINKCQFIATKSGLSLFHVTQYFKKIRQDHRDKRQKDSIKPSKNPRLAKVTRAADNFDRTGKSGKEPMHSRAIKLAMVNKNHTDPELEEDRPFIPDEEGFHSKVIGASDLVGQKSQYEQYKTRVKARNDYDFQILLVYTILKFRAYRDNVIHWIGTLELFPNTHREFCRRRISTLSKQPTVGLQLAQMKAQWRELYPEAIRTGALCEKLYDSDKNYQVIKPSNPNPLDPFSYLPDHIAHANYNLKEQLEYFEKHFVPNVEEGAHVKIVEDTPQKPLTTFHLPKSYTEIPELFFATTKSNVNLAIQSHHYYILPHYTLASTNPIDLPTAEQPTLEKICQTPCSKLVVAYKGHLEYSHDIVDFFEDRYDVKNSIKSRALLSFVINQTCRFNFVSLDDPTLNYIYPAHQPPKFNQINKVNPREHVLAGLIKMILFSPDNIYNQNLAHDLLQGFKDNTLTKVLNLLNQAGLITKRKTAVFEGNQAAKNNMFLNRVIPGRSLHMSDRFLLVVMGSFQPGILRQAGFYLHQLTHCHNEDKEKKFSISPLISSAGMMTLLDILASDHVQLIGQFTPPSEFRAESTRARKQKSDSVEFEVKLHFKQSYDSLSSTFVLDKTNNSGSKRSIEDEESGAKKSKTSAEERNNNNNEENTQKDLNTGEGPNKEFYWLQTYSEAEQAIMLKLIKLINGSKSTGFPEMHLARVFPDLTWAEFQRYLDILKCNEAAKQVGLDVKRWIGPVQDHNWKVNLNSNNLLSYSEYSQEAALGIDYDLPSPTTPTSNFSKYVSPRIWLDLNGDRNNEMYITMLDLVLRTIIRKPGITKSNLVRKLEGALTPIEIGELVDYLEQNSAIYSKFYAQPPKPGPFSRTKVFSPITKSVGSLKISEMERLITCYWPKPQCYAKFCQMV